MPSECDMTPDSVAAVVGGLVTSSKSPEFSHDACSPRRSSTASICRAGPRLGETVSKIDKLVPLHHQHHPLKSPGDSSTRKVEGSSSAACLRSISNERRGLADATAKNERLPSPLPRAPRTPLAAISSLHLIGGKISISNISSVHIAAANRANINANSNPLGLDNKPSAAAAKGIVGADGNLRHANASAARIEIDGNTTARVLHDSWSTTRVIGVHSNGNPTVTSPSLKHNAEDQSSNDHDEQQDKENAAPSPASRKSPQTSAFSSSSSGATSFSSSSSSSSPPSSPTSASDSPAHFAQNRSSGFIIRRNGSFRRDRDLPYPSPSHRELQVLSLKSPTSAPSLLASRLATSPKSKSKSPPSRAPSDLASANTSTMNVSHAIHTFSARNKHEAPVERKPAPEPDCISPEGTNNRSGHPNRNAFGSESNSRRSPNLRNIDPAVANMEASTTPTDKLLLHLTKTPTPPLAERIPCGLDCLAELVESSTYGSPLPMPSTKSPPADSIPSVASESTSPSMSTAKSYFNADPSTFSSTPVSNPALHSPANAHPIISPTPSTSSCSSSLRSSTSSSSSSSSDEKKADNITSKSLSLIASECSTSRRSNGRCLSGLSDMGQGPSSVPSPPSGVSAAPFRSGQSANSSLADSRPAAILSMTSSASSSASACASSLSSSSSSLLLLNSSSIDQTVPNLEERQSGDVALSSQSHPHSPSHLDSHHAPRELKAAENATAKGDVNQSFTQEHDQSQVQQRYSMKRRSETPEKLLSNHARQLPAVVPLCPQEVARSPAFADARMDCDGPDSSKLQHSNNSNNNNSDNDDNGGGGDRSIARAEPPAKQATEEADDEVEAKQIKRRRISESAARSQPMLISPASSRAANVLGSFSLASKPVSIDFGLMVASGSTEPHAIPELPGSLAKSNSTSSPKVTGAASPRSAPFSSFSAFASPPFSSFSSSASSPSSSSSSPPSSSASSSSSSASALGSIRRKMAMRKVVTERGLVCRPNVDAILITKDSTQAISRDRFRIKIVSDKLSVRRIAPVKRVFEYVF